MNTESKFMEAQRLSAEEFNIFSDLVYEKCGINLEPCKKTMLESRLNRRLRALDLPSFGEYIRFVTSKEGQENELVNMIDVVTTNKTDFFREPHHFDFLIQEVLPSFIANNESRPLRVWSAACSSGEEPYTLAMVLQDAKDNFPRFSYEILASDISTSVLDKAVAAIYAAEQEGDIPMHYRKKYLLKSKDASNPRIRMSHVLREAVKFFHMNLMDSEMPFEQMQDIIFCRNVLIYFDRETQLRVITNLLRKLKKGGLLFIGHSESLHFFDLPIKQIRPTIFIKN